MDPNRWTRIEELYHSALERPPDERAVYLLNACPDSELRREVEALLAQPAEGVLDRPSAHLIGGARLGPYEIVGCIGAGGMAAVYTARDPRVDRIVAIKISSTPWSGRDRREARAVAALNHPHICALYDVGPNYLVMEYVDGLPLHGPLPPAEAVRLARQLLDALDAAHRKGIIHRDLKPANILVGEDGVKVLDFGLAKMEAASVDFTDTETQQGVILGTLHYMSPEQVQGRPVDHRADLFSFGVVFYEMLTGRRAFDGPNSAAVVAAILEGDPPGIDEIGSPVLRRVLRRCLAKDPAERWQSAADLKAALVEDAPEPAPRRRVPIAWMVAACFAAVAGVLAVSRLAPTPPAAPRVVRLQLPLGRVDIPVLSPDGRYFVYNVSGYRALRLRALESVESQEVAGTDGALDPFWSPDGRQLAFISRGKLKRVDRAGGAPVDLADALGGGGGDWSDAGTILFSPDPRSPLFRIAAGGGSAAPVTALDRGKGEVRHGWPCFLPGGKSFLFTIYAADPENGGVFAGELDSPRRTRLLPEQTNARYVEPGFVLFSRGGALIAQRFDARRLRFTGGPVEVAKPAGAFSAAGGVLAYSDAAAADELRLSWFDREGRPAGDPGPTGAFHAPRISPDGRTVAVALGGEVWTYDVVRHTGARLTAGAGERGRPEWSPDGRQVAFSVMSESPVPVRRMRAGGSGAEEPAARLDRDAILSHWSPDGKYLIVTAAGFGKPNEVWAAPALGDGRPFPLVAGPLANDQGRVSPDDKWLAYAGNETGSTEIYVQAFPVRVARWRISNTGGAEPRWRADGRELFYREGTKVMSVEVRASAAEFDAGAPKLLFDPGPSEESFDVTADGRKFLLLVPSGEGGAAHPLTVVLNWPGAIMK